MWCEARPRPLEALRACSRSETKCNYQRSTSLAQGFFKGDRRLDRGQGNAQPIGNRACLLPRQDSVEDRSRGNAGFAVDRLAELALWIEHDSAGLPQRP